MGGLGLAKNVIAGTFNSFELISESVSSGLSSLSMDQQFI
jgi:6,7-dimethyl-8-ribityllumazine synthase